MKSENAQAVASALTGLRLFGIGIPAHPTLEQIQAEYEQVWQTINGLPIESLIDLPLMTDPEMQAAMQVLSVVGPSAYLTDFRLGCFTQCCMVKVGMQHGISGASAIAFGAFGCFLGPVFHRYADGYRFAKLACDLVEKHSFIAYRMITSACSRLFKSQAKDTSGIEPMDRGPAIAPVRDKCGNAFFTGNAD